MDIAKLPLARGRIGIERETLRTTDTAHLATTRHPESLGNVYTHPNITIDYAEALLELVTDAHHSPEAVYQQLLDLHRYTAQNIGMEKLWSVSMPCRLPQDSNSIEIGHFGTSNSGKIKRLYRVGLSHRYGRPMQMIAGVHFNYSPPDAIWKPLAAQTGEKPTQAYKDRRYMNMLRNLQRHGWLICHLFGASTATDTSFAPAHGTLDSFTAQTLGWRGATSLRMSSLGYQNKVDFTVSFNHLDQYIYDLATAVTTPAPAYEYLGLKDKSGDYQQINTHILQIANEYYTAARPKQPPKTGESPLLALNERGIAYIELRLLDTNPYDPCGISLEQIHFLETYLLWALITPAAEFTHRDYNELNHNRLRTACCGVEGDLPLFDRGKRRVAKDWAAEILHQLEPIATALDEQNHTKAYRSALQNQIAANVGKTPRLPQKVKAELSTQEFIEWAQYWQSVHETVLHEPLTASTQKQLNYLRDQSLAEFARIEKEAERQIPFQQYLDNYFAPIEVLLENG